MGRNGYMNVFGAEIRKSTWILSGCMAALMLALSCHAYAYENCVLASVTTVNGDDGKRTYLTNSSAEVKLAVTIERVVQQTEEDAPRTTTHIYRVDPGETMEIDFVPKDAEYKLRAFTVIDTVYMGRIYKGSC